MKLRLSYKNRTPFMKVYDKTDRIVSKAILLASAPILVPADTIATSIYEHKNPIKAFDKVSLEIRKRLNKGEGRGRHFWGANL